MVFTREDMTELLRNLIESQGIIEYQADIFRFPVDDDKTGFFPLETKIPKGILLIEGMNFPSHKDWTRFA